MGVIVQRPDGTVEARLGAAPALVETQCASCGGTGIHDYATDAAGELWPINCEPCDGHGTIWVCPICGEVPDAWKDTCACLGSGTW